MDTIGLNVHKRESQLCILAEDGIVTERRIVTNRERFTTVLGTRESADPALRVAGQLVSAAAPSKTQMRRDECAS